MSFLKSYADYADRITDAPPLFHTWTGIALLSAALGNGAWIWSWGRRICANLWIVLLAPSGILRKTTALNIGQGVLMDPAAGLADRAWPSEWSFEGLLQTMAQKPAGILFVREFKRFNAALMRDYAGGSKELLVDSYDNPERESRRTKGEGETIVEFPAPTILAATTMDWFEASLQRDDIGGGFLSRLSIIPAKEKGSWKGLGETRSDADRIQREQLADHLRAVRHGMKGELDISEIKEPFNEWLHAYEDSWAHRMTPELAGTIARTGANALQLTMIFEADTGSAHALSIDAFERARQMVELSNDQVGDLLAEGLGLSREAKERRTLFAAIRQVYPDALEHSTALKNSHLSADALKRHINTLIEADQVAVETISRPSSRPAKAYKWVNGTGPL